MMNSTYASMEDKKQEQNEWNTRVEKVLFEQQPLEFDSYLTLTDDHGILHSELYDYFNNVLKQMGEKIVLDLGGGDGYILRQGVHLPMKGVVLDISKNQLKLGKTRRGGQEIDFVLADADFLPFRPEVFDMVTEVGFLHHCAPRHEVVIKKISSLLRDGGRLMVVEGASIGPKLSFSSFLLFYFPIKLLQAIGFFFFMLNYPSRIKLRLSNFIRHRAVSIGQQKASLHPLRRPQFVTLLSRYFKIMKIRYHTWLSAFILDALVKIKYKRIRRLLINAFLPPSRVLDKAFCRSSLGKYSHIYSILVDKKRY